MKKTRTQFRKVVIWLLILLLIGIYFSFSKFEIITSYFRSLSETEIELNNVSTMVSSQSSGKRHTFTADFQCIVPKHLSSKEEVNHLHQSFADALSKADYDQLSKKGNVAYLKNYLSETVSFSDGTPLKEIYITSLLLDVGFRTKPNHPKVPWK